ncbi:hypothetical protein [Nocardiopsis nanhaiensis]
MSHSHSDRRSRSSLGTVLLAGACCAGAVAYASLVGPSMLPAPDVETTTAVTPEVIGSSAEEPEEADERGPIGFLRIHVSDRDRAWVQTLNCSGDLSEDPDACALMAEAAEEFAGDPTNSDPEETDEEAEQGEAEGADETAGTEEAGESDGANGSDSADGTEESEPLFAEVREGTVCTDKVYGPQEAAIEGSWEGEEVDTTLSRQGSCEEARWQRLSALTEQLS